MGEFFRGWKRKLGVTTLMMALALMVGWSRSLNFYNKIRLPVGTHAEVFVVSTNHFVGVGFEFAEGSPPSLDFYECKVEDTLPLNSKDEDEVCNPLSYARNLEWISQWHGFGMGGNFDELQSYWLMEWVITYWSITVPLTFISCWLLLSKPRKLTQMKIIEHIPTEGA